MASAELKARLEVAIAAARQAGEITLRYFRRDNFQVEIKQDASPVTVADRESEQYLREQIAAAFPGDGILGEEFGEQTGTSGYRWILDPIDGTKSFVYGVPLYGTLIGIEFEDRCRVGVINMPALDQRVYAAEGEGAWFQEGDATPTPARVNQTATLAESLFLTSEVEGFNKVGRFETFAGLQSAVKFARTWGDCYGYLLVATGRAEVMVDPRMSVWDAASMQPILEEAGGTFTDWEGQSTVHSGNGIATNGMVLEEVLKYTREQ